MDYIDHLEWSNTLWDDRIKKKSKSTRFPIHFPIKYFMAAINKNFFYLCQVFSIRKLSGTVVVVYIHVFRLENVFLSYNNGNMQNISCYVWSHVSFSFIWKFIGILYTKKKSIYGFHANQLCVYITMHSQVQ